MSYTIIVQTMYAAFARGDVAGLLQHVHHDVDWSVNVNADLLAAKNVHAWRPVRGIAQLTDFFKHVAQDYEIHRFQPLSFLETGKEVAVRLVMDSTVQSTGKRFTADLMHHFTFNDAGQVTRFREFADTLAESAAWSKD